MKNKILFAILSVFILMSCGQEKYEKSDIKETVVLNLDKCDEMSIDEIGSPHYEIVPLENNSQFMVGNVDKMIVTEIGIYISLTQDIPQRYSCSDMTARP